MKTNLNLELRRMTWAFFIAVGLMLVVARLLVNEERKNDQLRAANIILLEAIKSRDCSLQTLCKTTDSQRRMLNTAIMDTPLEGAAFDWDKELGKICK